MATVRLSDVVVPEVYAGYQMNDTTILADVFNSGLVVADGEMATKLSGGGRTFNHPYWGDLADTTDAVEGSDDPTVSITPDKVGTFKSRFVRQSKNKAWQEAELVQQLAGSDPMMRISGRTNAWWARQFDRYTIDLLTGVINANIAQNSGDMVYDITAKTGNVTVGAATVPAYTLNASSIIEAEQTAGDKQGMFSTIIMHSRIYSNLKLQNLIAFIPNSQGVVNIPTYQGLRVLVTDNVPVTPVASDLIYTTYVAAPGIIGFGESPVDMPVEVYREPLKANGSGIESLITRRQFGLHMYGYDWKDASVAGTFPTRAEVRTAANWGRAFPERKMIKFAAILSKNG